MDKDQKIGSFIQAAKLSFLWKMARLRLRHKAKISIFLEAARIVAASPRSQLRWFKRLIRMLLGLSLWGFSCHIPLGGEHEATSKGVYILSGLGLPSQEELESVAVREMSASPSWTCSFCDSITDEQK